MKTKEKHGKKCGSLGVGVIDTSKIPKAIKIKLLIQQLLDEWIKAGCPLEFKVESVRKENEEK